MHDSLNNFNDYFEITLSYYREWLLVLGENIMYNNIMYFQLVQQAIIVLYSIQIVQKQFTNNISILL